MQIAFFIQHQSSNRAQNWEKFQEVSYEKHSFSISYDIRNAERERLSKKHYEVYVKKAFSLDHAVLY